MHRVRLIISISRVSIENVSFVRQISLSVTIFRRSSYMRVKFDSNSALLTQSLAHSCMSSPIAPKMTRTRGANGRLTGILTFSPVWLHSPLIGCCWRLWDCRFFVVKPNSTRRKIFSHRTEFCGVQTRAGMCITHTERAFFFGNILLSSDIM